MTEAELKRYVQQREAAREQRRREMFERMDRGGAMAVPRAAPSKRGHRR